MFNSLNNTTMTVRQLTIEQKDALIGQTYDGVQFFNPTLDADGNWFISVEEYNCLTLVRANELGVISWWFDLPLVPCNPVITEFPQ
jgi:hypothetical protein